MNKLKKMIESYFFQLCESDKHYRKAVLNQIVWLFVTLWDVLQMFCMCVFSELRLAFDSKDSLLKLVYYV